MSAQSNSDFRDRRRFKRIADSFFVTYKVKSPSTVRIRLGDKECDALAQDIGEAGVGLLTNYEIPSDALLNLKFTIFNDAYTTEKDRSRKFELEGEVRYKVYTDDKSYRLGICFVTISAMDRDFIANYVRVQELKPGSDKADG